MKIFKKLLFLIPLVLLIVGCSVSNNSKPTTLDNTTTISDDNTKDNHTTVEQTTTEATTTEEDVFDVSVIKNFDDAAVIKGDGIFNKNSSTKIEITLNYGYEYVGLFNGEQQLTDELSYEITDITDNIFIAAIFKPINYSVNVSKNVDDEIATTIGSKEYPYKSSATIDFEIIDSEFLFVGLYDGTTLLTNELPYTIESVTKEMNLKAEFKQKTYDVVVKQSLNDAAVITGIGSFIKGSNTTITINTNPGYNYLGLYDGENELTTKTTYDLKNITEKVELKALFSANKYKVTTSCNDSALGTYTIIDGNYDCGSYIDLEVEPVTGYKLEGWYVNGVLYENSSDLTKFRVPAFDCEVVAKFTIKTFSVTITDNIDGLGDYYLNDCEYTSNNDYIYNWDSNVYYEIWSVKGYVFDYVLINGEKYEYNYEALYMDKNYELEVFYKLEDMHFYMMYDRDKLQNNRGIVIDILPDDFETGVIEYDYSSYKGYHYISGTYKYKTTINITLNIKTNYYLDGLLDTYDNVKYGSVSDNVITLTIDEYFNELLISLLGKICHIDVYSQDEITGSVTGTGDYHYGDKATIKATPNKGYKFIKWVDPDGNDYGVIYGYEHDYAPSEISVPLYGDATYIAVFVPDEFDCTITLVSRNCIKTLRTYVLTYLTEYDIEAIDCDGYTFAGWLENENIDSVFSADNVFKYTMTNENTTIYAYYTPNTYTVTFDFDGGSSSATTQDLVYGDEFETPIPTKENYTFGGYRLYFEEKTYNITEDNDGNQLYYYIRYKETNYNWLITNEYMFINDELVTNTNQTLHNGDIIKIIGHVSNIEVANASGIGTYKIAKDSKLVAHWMAKVTYLNYDGTLIDSKLVEINDTATNYYCSVDRFGYTYKYWSYNDEKFDFNTPITENITLVAYFEANEHDLKITKNSGIDSLIINGTTYTSTQTLKVKYDDIITISCTLRADYTFSYWYNKTLDEKDYRLSFAYTMPNLNIEFNPKTMSYLLYISVNESNYGSTDPVASSTFGHSVSYGDYLTVTATPNEGYAFIGWFNKNTDELVFDEAEYIFRPTDFDYDYTSGENFKFYIKAVFGSIKTEKYERLGNKIYFGYYPQTEITNNTLKDILDNLAGDHPVNDDVANQASVDAYLAKGTKWVAFNDHYYYPGGSGWSKTTTNLTTYQSETTYLNAPYMWYADVELEGTKYRGIWFRSYRSIGIARPNQSNSKSSSNQGSNGYGVGESYTYWFKYEKIEWDIIENNDGTVKLLANLSIDSMEYNYGYNSYDNSYVTSNIRNWLNGNFYNTAFSSLEKEVLEIMNVNNSKETTNNTETNTHASNTVTNDYVTLLSYSEANSLFQNNGERRTKATDYAKCQGITVTSDYSPYWLRSPDSASTDMASGVMYNGTISNNYVNYCSTGIRPVITITL